MNKKLTTLLVIAMCLTTTAVFADEHYEHRNMFNTMTDWMASMGKSSTEKQAIIAERTEQRADKREAHATYNQKKRELNENYKHDILAISDQNIPMEEMADQLKKLYASHQEDLRQLKKEMYEVSMN